MLRFQTDKLFFTWSQCPADKQDALAKLISGVGLQQRRKITAWLIGREQHQDGNYHLHAHIRIDRKLSAEFSADTFDIVIGDSVYHPNIKAPDHPKRNLGYCGKDGDYIYDGFSEREVLEAIKSYKDKLSDKKGKGKMAEIWQDLIDGGVQLKDLARKYPCQGYNLKKWVESYKIFKDLNRPDPKKNATMDNYWIYGPPGVGKTHLVWESFGSSCFEKPADRWWCGYNDEDTVLINDIGQDHKDLVWKLRTWSEENPFNAERRNTNPILLRPRRIVITSNYSLAEFLELIGINDGGKLFGALKRRFNMVYIPSRESAERVRLGEREVLSEIEVEKPLDIEGNKENIHIDEFDDMWLPFRNNYI